MGLRIRPSFVSAVLSGLDPSGLWGGHHQGVQQRVPCIMGSKEDVEECRKFYAVSNAL